MNRWRPSLPEFVAPLRQPRPWNDPLERLGRGIDNVHVDAFLSPRLRERISDTVRKLILEDVRAHGLSTSPQSVTVQDMDSFREGYLGVYEATLERVQTQAAPARLVLLQVLLLKCLLEAVARENLNLQEQIKGTAHSGSGTDSSLLEVHDDLVVLARDRHAINRRVLSLLLRQVKDLEGGRIGKLRAAVVGEAWPLPEEAFFNPVLSIPNLDDFRALAMDYPIACMADSGDAGWLFQTNQCISKVFQLYLPPWTQVPSSGLSAGGPPGPRERRDQGLLRGFLETEILLSRFVAPQEYRLGRSSWLDDPGNLRLFLCSGTPSAAAQAGELPPDPSHWTQPGWPAFQRAIVSELHHCLEIQGLTRRIALIYWLPTIRSQLGRPAPFSLALDFIEGRLSRRRLAERIDGLRLGLDPVTVARVLQRTVTDLKHLPPQGWERYLNRYLVDFLVLRRDLKLAYKTFEAMDGIRLIEEPNEVRLSRSNARLQEFPCRDELGPASRRIRAHAVVKADLRGSTRITETLHARGLNPASHFSLNFFDPVNRLLPEYGAEKLFVEGDAVILAIFEYDGAGPGTTVAQACVLARKILQVVDLQNARNRKHGLPELELGLGIAFSPREPSFLYDEGRQIMISEAINRADRLSACHAGLRDGGFTTGHDAFHVAEVRDTSGGVARRGDDLSSYNVNGIKIDQAAFFKLQKEIRLRQVRLPDAEAEDDILLGGNFPGIDGRNHWVVVRYGPVREWDGHRLGNIDPEHRHFFEVVVDQSLAARLRKVPH